MSPFTNRAALLLVGTLLAASACSGNGTVPSSPSSAGSAASQFSGADSNGASPDDNTSILKKLTKQIVIGSTVDPTNGDTGPHGLAVAPTTYGLKKGQLVVCNFADSSGAAGKGTTIDVLDPTTGATPTTFAQSSKIQGCAGDATTTGDGVYAAGLTSGEVVGFTNKGKKGKTYGSPFVAPLSIVDASNANLYAAEYIFASDANTGSIISFSINLYGNPKPTEIATGFAVNKASGWNVLGPSGLAYYPKKDILYIADGVDNTVVAFSHASELLVKDEIVVKPGGKTFTCKYPKTTCGTLVKAGKPLKAPEAMTVLPNGNLIVANTQGGNTLVEMTPTGKVLDTKVVDTNETAAIFGLVATGSNDTNTALFFTDANANNLQELEQ
jgi:hypothetical protein